MGLFICRPINWPKPIIPARGRNTSLKYWPDPKRLKSKRGAAKYKNIWLLGNGLCFENKLQKETFYCFPLLGISKQQQEDIAVSPQYWARAAASKVVEQQASPKISNFPFWFSQNQKTNSILRKGFEIENSIAVMSPLNGHNKGPYKRSFWFQHLWSFPLYTAAEKRRSFFTKSIFFTGFRR